MEVPALSTCEMNYLINSYVDSLFLQEKISQTEFCDMYTKVHAYCSIETEEDSFSFGSHAYEAIKKAISRNLDNYEFENLYKAAKFFKKLKEIEAFIYATFRTVDKFYVKFAGTLSTNDMFHYLVHKQYTDKWFNSLVHDLIDGIDDLRNKTTIKNMKNEVLNEENDKYNITTMRKVLKVFVSFFIENCIRNDRTEDVIKIRNKIIDNFVKFKDKNTINADVKTLFKYLSLELENYQKIFDNYMCKIIMDSISFDSKEISNVIVESLKTNKIKNVFNVLKYTKTQNVDVFVTSLLNFLEQNFMNKNYSFSGVNYSEKKENSNECFFIEFCINTEMFLSKNEINLNLKKLDEMLKKCYNHMFEGNEEFFEIIEYIKQGIMTKKYDRKIIALLIRLFGGGAQFSESLYKNIEILLFLGIYRQNDKNNEMFEKLDFLIKYTDVTSIKSKMYRLVNTFKSYIEEKEKMINVYSGLNNLTNVSMIRHNQILTSTKSNVLNYNVLKKKHCKGIINNILTGVIILYQQYKIRLNLISLNIFLFVNDNPDVGINDIVDKTQTEKSFCEFYVNHLLKVGLLIAKENTVTINNEFEDESKVKILDFYTIKSEEDMKTKETEEHNEQGLLIQAFIMRTLKLEKTMSYETVIQKVCSNFSAATNETVTSNLESLITKGYLIKEDKELKYVL
ncbi:hypothetical protein EHP00_898 [Ecytonucleospora hepatopenaei]|uniref:Cullin neddylation domain-containing protein n=1 Tax=Ecytonucleospora hepatopenaei TaxID=646526 RepID=A0A1W0E4R8_9MICR|nr:hypothetical protein EHP00_898 [Ecytonucleospora hepatopenaei]